MPTFIDQIQDYLDGNLSAADKEAFEAALLSDEQLANELQFRKMITNTIEDSLNAADGVDKLKSILISKNETYFSKEDTTASQPDKKIAFNSWKWVLAAAASLTLIFTLINLSNRDNFAALPIMPDNAVRGEGPISEYQKAANAFNDEHYEKSIDILANLYKADTSDASVAYFLGLSYLADKKYEQSISYLKNVAEGNSLYSQDATYYLGYVYYQSKDNLNARKVLSLINPSSPNFKKATKLLKQLN